MKSINKSPLSAFLLSFIPGFGHAYLGRYIRFIVYAGGFFGPLGILFLMLITNSLEDEIAAILIFFSITAAFVNMLDMVITLLTGKAEALGGGSYPTSSYGAGAPPMYGPAYGAADQAEMYTAYGKGDASDYKHAYSPHSYPYLQQSQAHQMEKTRTIMFSFIPGLGHMSTGLMQRGITFLVSFIGLFAIIVFLSVIMNSGAILIFLLALPVIWIYCMFDAIQLLNEKQAGAPIEDRSMFEQLESHVASGRKNKVLAISLSIFPGAGHLYLGLQKRGLQLMAGFLLAIYIMDNLRLTLFLFLLPLFWCFAFFDALQQTSRYERQALSDEPVLAQLVPYQRWLGIGLLGFGIYYLADRIIVEVLRKYWIDYNEFYNTYLQFKYMLPTVIIAFIMIIVGMRLAFGVKSKKTSYNSVYRDSASEKEGGPR